MSVSDSSQDQLYRITTLSRKLDVRPATMRKYLRDYGIEILDTPAGQRVTHSEWARFINLWYSKTKPNGS